MQGASAFTGTSNDQLKISCRSSCKLLMYIYICILYSILVGHIYRI